jgi:GT2 family glycosyltransferase
MVQSPPKISVVVVNYRSADAVERLVASVARSELAPHEVIVVDNASGDDSVARLDGRDDLRLVPSAVNTGFGGGCNLGAAVATGDLLLIANPDVRLRPGTLGALVRALNSAPEIGIACPDLLSPPFGDDAGRDYVEPVAAMAGAVMLIDRNLYDALGGFDPKIFLYAEDTDLCYRTWLAGRSVVKVWDAIGEHDVHGSGGGHSWSAEQIKNGLYVHLKLRNRRAIVRYAGRMAIKTVVRGVRMRDPRVVTAWWVAARDLRATLAERRRVRGAARPEDVARLDRLCLEHDHWSRTNWRRDVRAAVRRRTRR